MVVRGRKDSELSPPAQTEHSQGVQQLLRYQSALNPGVVSTPVSISSVVCSLACRHLPQLNTGVSPGTALLHGEPGRALWGVCGHSRTTHQPGHHFSFCASPGGWRGDRAGKNFLQPGYRPFHPTVRPVPGVKPLPCCFSLRKSHSSSPPPRIP